MSQPTLPPESARTLAYIEKQVADVMRRAGADPILQRLIPMRLDSPAAVIGFCLQIETREAAAALAAHVKRPFLDGADLILEMN